MAKTKSMLTKPPFHPKQITTNIHEEKPPTTMNSHRHTHIGKLANS